MKNILLFILITTPIFLFGQSKNDLLKKAKEELIKMSEEDAYKQGVIGFSFRSSQGTELIRFNASKVVIPASNMKVLTTATALKLLGENFRYETQLLYSGKITNGTLDGNILIKGSGDPTLGSDRIPGNLSSEQLINLFADKIRTLGIKKINGRIIQDAFCFDKNPIPDGWIWTDIGNYYGAGVYGINFNENLFEVSFKSGKKAGDSTIVLGTKPIVKELQFDNFVKTGQVGSGDNAWIFGAPYSNYRYMRGTIPPGTNEFSIKGSLPDPPYQLVNSLYEQLKNLNIEISEGAVPSATLYKENACFKAEASSIYIHQSLPLAEIVKYTNLFSINLYAEAIYRTVQLKFPFSDEVITNYWKSKGFIVEGNFIYDGSGLSPQNGVKTSFMTLVLFEISKDSVYQAFYNSLPIAGESGTLARFCKGTKAEKRIHAKSGSMDKVLGYSGFIKGKSGEEYSFSIIVNNFTGKTSATSKRIEKIMSLLVDL